MPQKENGIDVVIKVDVGGTLTAIAGFTSSTLTVDGSQIETSSGDEPDWETHVVGRRNWSMGHEGRLVTLTGDMDATLDALLTATLNGQKVGVEMDLGANGPTVSGTASILPFEVTGSAENDAAGVSCTLNGDGTLTKTSNTATV